MLHARQLLKPGDLVAISIGLPGLSAGSILKAEVIELPVLGAKPFRVKVRAYLPAGVALELLVLSKQIISTWAVHERALAWELKRRLQTLGISAEVEAGGRLIISPTDLLSLALNGLSPQQEF